jgi:hypothetical protein
MSLRVPAAFASLLAHERDTPSCLAITAILDAGQYGFGNDESFRYSTFGQAWRPTASSSHGVLSHLPVVAKPEKR